jgi:hypothetical protein
MRMRMLIHEMGAGGSGYFCANNGFYKKEITGTGSYVTSLPGEGDSGR